MTHLSCCKGYSLLKPVALPFPAHFFPCVLMLIGQPCASIDGFKLAKKSFGRRGGLIFYKSGFLKQRITRTWNTRAIARAAVGE